MNGTWNQHTNNFPSKPTHSWTEEPDAEKEEWKMRALEETNHREKEIALNIQCLISNLSQLTSNLARRWISGRQTSLACEKPIPTAFPSHRWTGSPRLALWVMAHRQSAVLPDSEPLRSSPVCPLCCLPTGSTFSPSLFTVPWHCSTAQSCCIPAPLCLGWWREER